MQELIDRLTAKTGITADQATKSLETIKEYVKEKFPMLGDAVDNMFAPKAESNGSEPVVEKPADQEHSILDKISDVIPGSTGEKVEEFAKNTAHKVEDDFEGLKEKLGEMFGGDKK